MKKNFINFLSVALVITGLLVTADGYAKKNWEPYNLDMGIALIFLFLFLYAFLHWRVLGMAEKRPNQFVNGYMAMFGIKMLVLLGVLGVFIYTHPEQKISFLLLFAPAYALHTINEVYWASKYVKKTT